VAVLSGLPFGHESSVHSHGLHGTENLMGDRRIRPPCTGRNAPVEAVHRVADAAGVPRLRRMPPAAVGDLEHPPTAPAAEEAREQRVSTATGLGATGGFAEGIARQPLLILLELLPRDVGLVMILHQRRPRLHWSPPPMRLAHDAVGNRRPG